MIRTTCRRRHGTTFIELLVATLLISVALAAALNSTGSAVRASIASANQNHGWCHAEELLGEMLAMPYHDPQATDPDDHFGIEPDEDSSTDQRVTFDDLDDFDNWTESAGLLDRNGVAIAGFENWQRSVVVEKLNAKNPKQTFPDSAPDCGVRRLIVTVTSPTGEEFTSAAIRSLLGAGQQQPAVDSELTTAVFLELRVGDNRLTNTINTVNHAEAP